MTRLIATALALAFLVVALPASAQVAEVKYSPTSLDFFPVGEFAGVTLRVQGGDCFFEQRYKPSEFRYDTSELPDGQYAYELVGVPILTPDQRRAYREVRKTLLPTPTKELKDKGLFAQGEFQSGSFIVLEGIVQNPDEGQEEPRGKTGPAGQGGPELSLRDFVINDDLIVDGSACIGFDCVNGEVFSFDTLRLKENNLRIKFDDTSVVPSFPANDWQLTANESANGGASKFSIEDVSGGRTPFTVEANARSHSLYVDDGGRIGSRTSTPSVEIHTIDGDTPTLRLQQDGSSGFAPQTWDVAGNETNFFIRDVTNGSALPFRIRPQAPTNAIFVDVDGDLGAGTSSPDASLHVNRTNGSAQVLVEEGSGTAATRKLLRLVNNGRTDLEMENTNAASNTVWQFIAGIADGGGNTNGQGFAISRSGSGVTEFEIQGDGDVFVGGALAHASSRALKENFVAVDSTEILDRVKQLPLTTWNYRKDTRSATHLGPVAEDFFAAFGLGEDDRHISPSDAAGIALASIQALADLVDAKDQRIASLEQQLAGLPELEARLKALEALLLAAGE